MEDPRPRDAYGQPIREVHVTDISVPFWSMLGLLVQAAIAAIPAFFILAITWKLTVTAWEFFIYVVARARVGH